MTLLLQSKPFLLKQLPVIRWGKPCLLNARVTAATLQEENFHWKINLAISLMPNWLNILSYFFRNLSIIAYIMKFENQNSLIFNFVNLTNLSQVAKLNSVYIFIL